MSFPAPPVRSASNSSSPPPPFRRSLPFPPKRTSSPEPPNTKSFPRPPRTMSSPALPSTTSLPFPPRTRSSPPCPWTWSSPFKPLMVSLASVPSMSSLPEVPLIISLATSSISSGLTLSIWSSESLYPSTRTSEYWVADNMTRDSNNSILHCALGLDCVCSAGWLSLDLKKSFARICLSFIWNSDLYFCIELVCDR